jgi:hypothetical protein
MPNLTEAHSGVLRYNVRTDGHGFAIMHPFHILHTKNRYEFDKNLQETDPQETAYLLKNYTKIHFQHDYKKSYFYSISVLKYKHLWPLFKRKSENTKIRNYHPRHSRGWVCTRTYISGRCHC